MQYSTLKKIILYISLEVMLTSYLTCTASQEASKEELERSKNFTFHVHNFPKEILITHILSDQDTSTLLAVRLSSKLLKEYAEDLSIWKKKLYIYLQHYPLDAYSFKNLYEYFSIYNDKNDALFIQYQNQGFIGPKGEIFWLDTDDDFEKTPKNYYNHHFSHDFYTLSPDNLENFLKKISLIQNLLIPSQFLFRVAGIYKVMNIWKKLKKHYFIEKVPSQEVAQYFKSFVEAQYFDSLLRTTFSGNLNIFLTEHNLISELLLLIRYNPFIIQCNFLGCKIGDKDIENIIFSLQSVKHLQYLFFSQTNIGDEIISYISNFIENHKSLKLLDLSHNNFTDKGAIVLAKSLKKNSSLLELNMSNNDIYDQGLTALKKISNEKNFTLKWKSPIISSPAELESLSESSLVHSGDIEIENWLKNSGETLSLSNRFISTFGVKNLLIVLSEFTQLRNLQLNHVNSYSTNLAHLISEKIVKNSYLTSLSLDGFPVFTTLLKALPQEQSLPSLECLNLINNNINNDMLHVVRFIKSLTCLRELSLIENNITNKDMWILGKLFKNNFSLLALNLSGNKFNMHGVNDFLMHAYCLKELILNNNHLEHFPVILTRLTQLEILHLNDTKLNYLPREISRLIQLKELNLGHNSLTDLPTELYQLTNLLSLALHSFNVLELNNFVKNFSKIKTLKLNFLNLTLKEIQIFDEFKNNNPNLVIEVDNSMEEVD